MVRLPSIRLCSGQKDALLLRSSVVLWRKIITAYQLSHTIPPNISIEDPNSKPSSETPIYQAFPITPHLSAFYTSKGTSRTNHNFSFSTSLPTSILSHNLTSYTKTTSLSPTKITWPNGPWPHSGKVIIAEQCKWTTSTVTGGLIPWTMEEPPARIQYDGIVTRSPDYILGVQGADCPAVFLVDEVEHVIGLAHSGWKPTVRNVAENLVRAMEELGAVPEKIIGFVAPGVGDRYNEFSWDGDMESSVRKVFVDAGREESLVDEELRYVMSEEDRRDVEEATEKKVRGGVTFKIDELIVRDLVKVGIKRDNIRLSGESTICSCLDMEAGKKIYKYHSCRRDNGKDPERPGFGSSLCLMQLQ